MTPQRLENRQARMRDRLSAPSLRVRRPNLSIATPPAIQEILWQAELDYGLERHSIRSGRQFHPIPAARTQAAQVMHDERGLSLNQIGCYLGGMHHSSVLAMLAKPRKWTPKERPAVSPFGMCDEEGW